MKDAPAYDWFPERFWFAVDGWTDREIVAYKRLLDQQWLRDGLPDDPKALARLAHGKVPPAVLDKFPLSEDGLRRNPFMETIRASQRERIAKRREGAAITNAKRWNNDRSATRSATVERQNVEGGSESPPPTPVQPTAVSESENARPREPGSQASEIASLYPANGNAYEAAAAIVRRAEAGEDLGWMRQCAKLHADRWHALPKAARRFCPGKVAYFAEARWRDNPDEHPWVDVEREAGSTKNGPKAPSHQPARTPATNTI